MVVSTPYVNNTVKLAFKKLVMVIGDIGAEIRRASVTTSNDNDILIEPELCGSEPLSAIAFDNQSLSCKKIQYSSTMLPQNLSQVRLPPKPGTAYPLLLFYRSNFEAP